MKLRVKIKRNILNLWLMINCIIKRSKSGTENNSIDIVNVDLKAVLQLECIKIVRLSEALQYSCSILKFRCF